MEYEGIDDLWTVKLGPSLLDNGDQSVENTPFTTREQAQISRQLREIKNYLKTTRSLTEDQLTRVDERLDEADRASNRMGRKDWALLLSGTLLTMIVADLIPPDIVQHVYTMVLHGLGHLFGGSAPGPGSLPE